jgi:Tfp pilus assembly protein PilV
MKKRLLQKLKSTKGESISEVLIAAFVVAMGFLMVMSMVSVSYKTIQKTDTAMKNYYEEHNAFETGQASTTTGTLNVTTVTDGSNATTVSDASKQVIVEYETITLGGNDTQFIQYKAKAGS